MTGYFILLALVVGLAVAVVVLARKGTDDGKRSGVHGEDVERGAPLHEEEGKPRERTDAETGGGTTS